MWLHHMVLKCFEVHAVILGCFLGGILKRLPLKRGIRKADSAVRISGVKGSHFQIAMSEIHQF